MGLRARCSAIKDFPWQDIVFCLPKKVKGLNKEVHTRCNPSPNVNNSIFYFTAISFCPQSSCHRTSRWQHQTTGRHEHVDRRITRRSFSNLCPRSENIWRKTSESASGNFFLYANASMTPTSICTWRLPQSARDLFIRTYSQIKCASQILIRRLR